MSYDLMDVHDAKRKLRGRSRRAKQRGPCSCPQCLMTADLADKGFDIGSLSDTLMDMGDEDFDAEDFDAEDCKDDFDDENFDNEDFDDYDAKRRSQSKKRQRRSQRVPCSLMAADLEDDEDYDDENDLDNEFMMIDGDEDDLDDEDYDNEDDLDNEFMMIDGDEDDLDDEDYDDEDDLGNEFMMIDGDEDDLDEDDYNEDDDNEFMAMDDDEDDYDDEDDLDEDDYDDDEFMAMDDDDEDDVEYSFEDEAFDVRTVKVRCPGIKKVRVRKNRDREEPFTSQQQESLCSSVRLAYTEARNVAAALDQIWYQKGLGKMRKRRGAWRNNPAIARWFGTKILTRRQIRVTRRRVKRILKFFERGITFVIVQHQTGKRSWLCDEETRAYAWGGSRVFLCPRFFQDGNLRARARTIIHELVHKIGWGHPRLRGSGHVSITATHQDRALELARRFPMRARRSPVNFAWLYDEFRPRF